MQNFSTVFVHPELVLWASQSFVLVLKLHFCLLAEPSASPAKDNYRMNRYKNKALNPEEMRRRREEEGIQLRKQKREQQVYCPCRQISHFSG